jgi:hypothetical protein
MSSPSPVPSPSDETAPAAPFSLNCPCGRHADLKVINRNAMLVECLGNHPNPCPYSVVFGGGVYCGYFLRIERGDAALRQDGKNWG